MKNINRPSARLNQLKPWAASFAAGAALASLSVLLLTRAARVKNSESVDDLLQQCGSKVSQLESRFSRAS